MRVPQPGELQIVIYSDNAPIIVGWLRADRLDEILANVEKAREIGPEARHDAQFQIGGRMYIYEMIAQPGAEQAFHDHLASEIIWLAVNHFGQNGTIRKGIDDALAEHGFAVITISITTHPHDRVAGTRWGVTVGAKDHDTREQVAALEPGAIEMFGTSVTDFDQPAR
jgi:hypothetical protein